MRAAGLAVALASLAACGGAEKPKAAAPKLVAVDEKQAAQGAKDLVEEVYETLNHGSTDSFFSLLADPLVAFGPRRTDASATRTELLVQLKPLLDPKANKHVPAKSGALHVVTSPGGHSAWATDVVTVNGAAYAVTAVLSNTGDLWNVSAVVLAELPAAKALRPAQDKDAIVPPGAVTAFKIAPGAKGAAERFARGVADPAVFGDDLGSRTDAIYVGPAAGDVARGKKDVKALWDKRADAHVREAVNGDVTGASTADGQLAWISADVARVEDGGAPPLPLRVFAVYEKDGSDWHLIALHEAIAMGEPGAGAPFHKVLPAAPKPPAPPPEVEKKDEPPPKTAAAKKKKKKKEPEEKIKVERDDPPPDDAPTRKHKFSKAHDMDAASEDDDAPKKKKVAKKKHADDDAAADDDAPKLKKKKHKADDDAADDDAPKAKKKKKLSDDDVADDDAPKKKHKRAAADDSDDDAPKAKKKHKLSDDDDADDDAPKKKKKKRKPPSDDDEN